MNNKQDILKDQEARIFIMTIPIIFWLKLVLVLEKPPV